MGNKHGNRQSKIRSSIQKICRILICFKKKMRMCHTKAMPISDGMLIFKFIHNDMIIMKTNANIFIIISFCQLFNSQFEKKKKKKKKTPLFFPPLKKKKKKKKS